METLFQDLRYAARTLQNRPSFTIVAVLTLALGIGVNTTFFTLFNGVALKPLPVRDPASVVRIVRWFESGARGDPQYLFSYPEYMFYREHNRVFSSLVASTLDKAVLAELPVPSASTAGGGSGQSGESEVIQCQLVSGNFFSALGADAVLGRTFLSEEDQTPGSHPVVVLSYPFWQRRFDSDPQVLGKILKLNGAGLTVVGVASPTFIGGGNPPQVPHLWAPLMMQAVLDPGRDLLHRPSDTGSSLPLRNPIQLIARLKPGLSRTQAQIEMLELTRQFARVYPEKDKTIGITVKPATFFGDTDDIRFQGLVALVMAVVAMVLLLACTNLANMLLPLAAGAARQKEIAVRVALGAGRVRLMRQLLTESVLLGLLGGAVGLLLSIWASDLLWVITQQWIEQAFGATRLVVHLDPDIRVFAYTLLVSLLTGIIFGLAPALQTTKPNLTAALKEEGTTLGLSLSRSRFRNLLVTGQVAVSLVLLIAAGLLARDLMRARKADAGFETKKVLIVALDLGRDPVKGPALLSQIIGRLEALPQVKSLGFAERAPMIGHRMTPISIEGSHAPPGSVPAKALCNFVSPTYFQTLGIPIVRGRSFNDLEAKSSTPVVIVSESTARRLWPGEDPIGKRLKTDLDFSGKFSNQVEVIGLAKDVRNTHLSKVDPTYLYFPAPTDSQPGMSLLVRIEGSPGTVVPAIRTSLGEVERNLPVRSLIVSLENGPLQFERLIPQICAILAAVAGSMALLLTLAGIYGVIAYTVSQRTREIGIRMALGAKKSDVLRLVLLQGMRPVLAGMALGLLGACALSGLLRPVVAIPDAPDLLFGVSPLDTVTFLGVSLLLAATAMLACLLPARRGTKVDPMAALRYE